MGFRFIIACALLCSICACRMTEDHFERQDFHDYHDPTAKLQRQDFRDLTRIENKQRMQSRQNNGKLSAPIPEVSQILAAPRPSQEVQEQKISITITEDIPLKDVFIELARLANMDLQLDTQVAGGIIFRAKDKPLSLVVSRICETAKLKCSFENNVLIVDQDVPVLKNYELDFLNVVRTGEGEVNISTNVLSAGDAGGGDSLNTGSSIGISSQTGSDIWEKFEEAITSILGNNREEDAEDNNGMPQNFFVLNKQGGILTVYAPQAQQKKITEYVHQLQSKASAQVLIEAKIVEVSLNEEYRSGIDWGSISLNDALSFDFEVSGRPSSTDPAMVLSFSGEGANPLEAALELTKQFGTTRTLSSPRVHAMNNQQAVLTFAENYVYFDISVEREQQGAVGGGGGGVPQNLVSLEADPKTVPLGIIVNVQPSINARTGEITMNVRPTLSRAVRFVNDPSVPVAIAQINASLPPGSPGLNVNPDELNNAIPVVEVREIDTVMKMRDGEVLVMGGLMEERAANTERGVPFMSDIPFLGNAFKGTEKTNDVVEMVIFIKATIIPNTGAITEQDINVYQKFTNDPRPLAF